MSAELAEAIRDAYTENPDLTAFNVAESLDVTVNEVWHILDSWFVHPDGSIEELGGGQGGNWVPEELQAQTKFADTLIGYAWPDGSIRNEPFTGEVDVGTEEQ